MAGGRTWPGGEPVQILWRPPPGQEEAASRRTDSVNALSAIVQAMRSDRALDELQALKEAAATLEVQREGAAHDAWKAKVIVVMRQALGDKSTTLDRFTNHRYSVGVWTGSPDEAERDRRYFAGQVTRAAALIDAAIYEVELMAEGQNAEPDPLPDISGR